MKSATKAVWALRSLLYVIFLAVTVVPWGTAMVVLSAFTRGAPVYWGCVGWLRVAMWGVQVICGVRWRVTGMQHVPTAAEGRAAVLLAPKHQSTLEAFLFPTLMPHPLAYVFKRELIYIPFFGWAMSRMDMIHIDRSKRAQAWNLVAEQGKRLFAQGVWVIMFPEGTRIPRGRQGTYKTGASRLAIAAGVPIVPIAVTSAKCWPRKSFLIRPGTIDISLGPPIVSVGRDAESLTQDVQQWIETEMRRLDPEAYVNAPPV